MEPTFFRSACIEKRLLTRCARAHLESDVAAEIRRIASGSLDWDYVAAQARDHSTLSLTARNLRAAAVGAVPATILTRLETEARASAMRCLAQTSELIHVVELLASRGIRTLPYKGPVIAAQAYGDIAARQFEDLDVILAQRDVPLADAVLRSIGYEPRLPWLHAPEAPLVVPGEYNYFHNERRTILELHTEATLRHFPARPRLEEFFDRAACVNLGGQTVRTFRAEDALPVYCVHGTKDFWVKLIWITDIAELLRSRGGLDWDSVLRVSERLRVQRMLNLGLALVVGILDADLPSEIIGRVKRDSHATAMATELARPLLGRESQERTARERFSFRRHTVEGSAAGWRYALRLTFAPSEEDWSEKSSPPRGGSFHPLLRPFRLLRKYGWTSRS
jgi:Uncharacterised nucleotidyltransferase